uniref:Uncharacterized protein n=1 Tax=Lactuca sativa TaxID=4236 RepID=A0A9R1XQG7_LACSA|nr:hypothetical protein LSAT_V11C200071040 [Lactuca sativa]
MLNLWAHIDYIKPFPLMFMRMPGRPTTRHASKKDNMFSTTKVKVSRTVRCTKYLEYSHNQRACKNERKQYVPPLIKKTGRTRKHIIPSSTTSIPNQPPATTVPNQANSPS